MTILIDHGVDKEQDAFSKLRLKLKDTDTPSVHRTRIKMEMPTEELFKLVGSRSLNDRPKSPNNVMLTSTSKLLAKVSNGERKMPDTLRLPSMQQAPASANSRNRAGLYNRQSSTGSRKRSSLVKKDTFENVASTPESPIDDSSSHETPEQTTRERNSSERASRTSSGACSPSLVISANELQRVTASPRRGSRSRSTERGSRSQRSQSQGPGSSARRGRRSTSVSRSSLRADAAQQTRLQTAARNAPSVEMPRKESRGRGTRAPSANGRIDQSLREWVREHSASPRARAAQDSERPSSRGTRSRHGERSSARGARSMSCCRSERIGERRARKSECLPPMAPQLTPNRANSDPTSKTEGPLSGSQHSRNSRSKSTTKRASRRSMRGEHKVAESKSEREPSFHNGDDEIFAVVPVTRNFAGASKWKSLTKRSDLSTNKPVRRSSSYDIDLNDLFQKSLEMDDWKPE
eukprot:Nitzschia sp. Nitz4//scaffold87_size112219//79171//80562//NITZ4_004082-RA/size112219-processed-gene-0.140-mRNA-1//-1//CDS//3329559393//5618//frame0